MKMAFEGDVKIGELRVFADLDRPVVALIAEDHGAFGFRVIPVSDFTGVSCEGEQLVGGRVYQHWNACNVSRSFAVRSWVVATLPASEFSVISSSTFSASASSLRLSPYQRAYLFSIPNILGREEKEAPLSRFSFSAVRFPFRKAAGFALAACFVLALVFAVRFDLDRATQKEERAHAWQLVSAPAPEEPLVADESGMKPPAEDPIVVAEVKPAFALLPPGDIELEREPEVGARAEVPKMAKVESLGTKARLSLDKVDVAVMRLLPRKSTDEHAVAVMTYLACGVTAGDAEFGGKFVESTERLAAFARDGSSADEYTRRLVATALCKAYAATSNPDLKTSAEAELDSLGDKRSVEIVARGYGLIEDWFASSARTSDSSAPGVVAAPLVRPDWFKFLQAHSR